MVGFMRFLALLIGGALAAWALWLAEVCLVKGWAGPSWAERFSWSALPICAVIAMSCSYLLAPSAPRPRHLMFIAMAFALNFAAFLVARWALVDMFGGRWIFPDPLTLFVLWLTSLILSAGLATAADHWLAPLRIWTVALISIALLVALLLSYATFEVLPVPGGNSKDVRVFKIGYPVFWIALLLPLSLRLGRKGGRSVAVP